MREAIGGTWLFGLVLTFIVFFASFLAISINYSIAFNVKNNIVDLVSKYEGNNNCARKQISDYLEKVGYLVPGDCPKDDAFHYTGYGLDGRETTGKAYYCISNDTVDNPTVVLKKNYYRVVIFFKIDLPLVGNLTTFKIKGETESIYYPNEKDNNLNC